MKKNWTRLTACLALAAMLLTCSALAAAGQGTDGWTRAVDDATVTATVSGDKATGFTVKYTGSDLVSGNEYSLLIVDLKSTVDAKTVDLATITSGDYESISADTIRYVDQATEGSGVSFENFMPKSVSNSVVLLGGEFSGGTQSPKVLGVIIGHGVTVSGAVTAKGAAATDTTATVALDESTTTSVSLTSGAGTYSFEGVNAGTYTMTASSGTKYTAREYAVDTNGGDAEQDVELWPKGDVNGDGLVNLGDYTLVLRHVKNINKLSGYAYDCGNVNGDRAINLGDYTLILRHIKKISSLW